MRVISYVNGNSGPCYHRLIMPLILMEDIDVFITNDLRKEHFEKGCDLFIYNRVIPQVAIPEVNELKEKYGFKVCVDVDDFWELDPHHVLYDEYERINFARFQIQHITDADFVTTTHGRLRDQIKQYNRNVFVLPNAIPHVGQFDLERKHSQHTRLFWQGSITHREDIALLQQPIDNLKDIAGKIKMIMAGFTDGEPEWHIMTSDYTSKHRHQYHILEGRHVNDYYKHYEHADICLVPLVASKFNGYKSNLKVLEAANLGLPVICSHVDPYLDLPVLYARNASEWERQMRRLIGSSKRRKEAGERLKFYCDLHFDFYKINRERKQLFEYQTSKQLV